MLRLRTVCLLVRWTTKTNSSINPGVIRHIRRSNADTCRLAENPAFANQGERDCRRLDRSCGTPCRYLRRDLIAVWGMHEQERLGKPSEEGFDDGYYDVKAKFRCPGADQVEMS